MVGKLKPVVSGGGWARQAKQISAIQGDSLEIMIRRFATRTSGMFHT
jgi:hypothetical protein